MRDLRGEVQPARRKAWAQPATEVFGCDRIGLPEPARAVAMLPNNVAEFGSLGAAGPATSPLYRALRECGPEAAVRGRRVLREQMPTLWSSTPQESHRYLGLRRRIGQLDPANLAELSSTLEGTCRAPEDPEQRRSSSGGRPCWPWSRMGGRVGGPGRSKDAAGPLAETVRRARATGGPAEATFATLVGLELRPRRMRDAANLWAALRDARGTEGRDAVWSHPDLVPTSADLDDPLGFASAERDDQAENSDFDAALGETAGTRHARTIAPTDSMIELDGADVVWRSERRCRGCWPGCRSGPQVGRAAGPTLAPNSMATGQRCRGHRDSPMHRRRDSTGGRRAG